MNYGRNISFGFCIDSTIIVYMNRFEEFLFLLFASGIGVFHKLIEIPICMEIYRLFMEMLRSCGFIYCFFLRFAIVVVYCLNWVYQLIHVNLNYFLLSHERIACMNGNLPSSSYTFFVKILGLRAYRVATGLIFPIVPNGSHIRLKLNSTRCKGLSAALSPVIPTPCKEKAVS